MGWDNFHGTLSGLTYIAMEPAAGPGPRKQRKLHKRRRPNYSKDEVSALMEGVMAHRDTVYGKQSKHVSETTKITAWTEIVAKVNKVAEKERDREELSTKLCYYISETKKKLKLIRQRQVNRPGSTASEMTLTPNEKLALQIAGEAVPEWIGGGACTPHTKLLAALERENPAAPGDDAMGSPLPSEHSSAEESGEVAFEGTMPLIIEPITAVSLALDSKAHAQFQHLIPPAEPVPPEASDHIEPAASSDMGGHHVPPPVPQMPSSSRRQGMKRKAPTDQEELLGVQKRIASGIEMMVELFRPISEYYARKNAEFESYL